MPPVDTLELLRTATEAAIEKKSFNLVALEVTELTSYADNFLLCSASSERQVGAIADEVERRAKESGRRPLHKEGASRSEWVLLDYGDVVVHIFTEEKRSYYALDGLWGDAPGLDIESLVDGEPAEPR